MVLPSTTSANWLHAYKPAIAKSQGLHIQGTRYHMNDDEYQFFKYNRKDKQIKNISLGTRLRTLIWIKTVRILMSSKFVQRSESLVTNGTAIRQLVLVDFCVF